MVNKLIYMLGMKRLSTNVIGFRIVQIPRIMDGNK